MPYHDSEYVISDLFCNAVYVTFWQFHPSRLAAFVSEAGGFRGDRGVKYEVLPVCKSSILSLD
jgi:hypothetical protein